MNRQNIQESEQMITTKGQIMSACKKRMILLFNSTILQRDCCFVEKFCNFERRINNEHTQRSSTEEKQEKKGLVKNKMVGVEGKKDLCQWREFFSMILLLSVVFRRVPNKINMNTNSHHSTQSSAWTCATSKCTLQQHCMGSLN